MRKRCSMFFDNPFEKCPEFETDNFLINKTKIEDAVDLFEVYSDLKTKAHINTDQSDVCLLESFEGVQSVIKRWEKAYNDRDYIRWTIVSKDNMKCVGTIELAPTPKDLKFFDGLCRSGILRVDLLSTYETEAVFSEIYAISNTEIIELFGIEKLITKGNLKEINRIKGLRNGRYVKLIDDEITKYPDYYISYKW